MAFAEDLLKQALLLLHKEPKTPTQASLRRSVSTAYYALFHLLIQDACANWSRLDTRDHLARAFEHKTMKDASTRAENATYDPSVPPHVWPSCAPSRGHSGSFRFNATWQTIAMRLSGTGSRHLPKSRRRRLLFTTGRQSAMSTLLSDISSLF